MRFAALLAVTLLAAGCRGDALGQPCERDQQCGPGFDCYPDVCVRVCTSNDECQPGTTCYRYHCVAPDEAGSTPTAEAGSRAVETPPVPDATAAELRAMRYELGELRRDVARLLQAQGLSERAPLPQMPVPDVPKE